MSDKRQNLDHEMARSIAYWLDHTSRSLPDNPAGRDRFLDEFDQLPQRAHRWLPPIATGGVRVAFTTLKYATGAAFIAVLGGLLLLSGALEQAEVAAPAVASPTPTASPSAGIISHVTGTTTQQWVDSTDQTSRRVGGVHQLRGAVIVRQNQWSDPRLPAQSRFRLSWDEYLVEDVDGDDQPWIGQGFITMSDADGSWSGTGQLLEYPRSAAHDEWYVLEGAGAYEGLTAILRNHNELDPERKVWLGTWEGFIVDGALPPLPDTVRSAEDHEPAG